VNKVDWRTREREYCSWLYYADRKNWSYQHH